MQKGSALITALLITAIAAAVATAIAVHVRVVIRESQLAQNFTQTYRDLQGIQYWGINQITQNGQFSQQNHTVERYPQMMPTMTFHQTQLSGAITDTQALFNINSLNNPAAQAQFIRLLKAVAPDTSDNQVMAIAKAITAWLGISNADSVYLRAHPPYRAAHQMMANISELRLIDGISAKLYFTLLPYLIALPSADNQINIINAPIPILRSLGMNITAGQASTLAACRQQFTALNNLDELKQACITKPGLQIDPNINLITNSRYFIVKGYAQSSDQTMILYSLINRIAKQNEHAVYTSYLIAQSLNTP